MAVSIKAKVGQKVISIDADYFRPTEVDLLIGDPSKAKKNLGWVPKHDFQSLVKEMALADFKLFKSKL